MHAATLHDGTTLEFTTKGQGPGQAPTLLLSVGTSRPTTTEAAEARAHGLDPQPGITLTELLSPYARLVVFNYEAHVLQHPKHRTLTLDHVSADILAIADAANTHDFAFYGSSWLAMIGAHLSLTSPRLTGYVMGGFPPVNPPLTELLDIARQNHAAIVASPPRVTPPRNPGSTWTGHALLARGTASGHAPGDRNPRTPSNHLSKPGPGAGAGHHNPGRPDHDAHHPAGPDRTQAPGSDDAGPEPVAIRAARARQFVTFFADATHQPYLRAPLPDLLSAPPTAPFTVSLPAVSAGLPRVCVVGEDDVLRDAHGHSLVFLAEPVLAHREALENAGWVVHILPGKDGVEALQPTTLAPILTTWLTSLRTHKAPVPAVLDDHRAVRDPVSALLASWGVREALFDDPRLRAATRALLHFLGNQKQHDQHHQQYRETRSGTTITLRGCVFCDSVGVRKYHHATASAGSPRAVGPAQELLEVQVIRRLNELNIEGDTQSS